MAIYEHNKADVEKWNNPNFSLIGKKGPGNKKKRHIKAAKPGKGKYVIVSELEKQSEEIEKKEENPGIDVQYSIFGAVDKPVTTDLKAGKEKEQIKQAQKEAGGNVGLSELQKEKAQVTQGTHTTSEKSRKGSKSRDITAYRKYKGGQIKGALDPIKKFEVELFRKTKDDPSKIRLTKYTKQGEIRKVKEAEFSGDKVKKAKRLKKKSERILSRLSKKTEFSDRRVTEERFKKKGYGFASKIFTFDPKKDR